MVVEKRPRVNIKPFQHICHNLIGWNVPVLFLKANIIPNHIIRIIEILAF